MNIFNTFIKCEKCKTINRIPVEKISKPMKCGKCHSQLKLIETPIKVMQYTFKNEVFDFPGIVLVVFSSPNCPHCVRISPVIDEIAKEKKGVIKVVKINSDEEQNLCGKFNIDVVPTLILFSNGNKTADLSGALTKEEILEWIERNIVLQPVN